MPRPRFFVFDDDARVTDEEFTAALRDPIKRRALVFEAIDSIHGLSQPWAPRMKRLLAVLADGPDADETPTPPLKRVPHE